MNFDNIANKIEETNRKMKELKEAHMKELRGEFHTVLKEFFNEVPQVQAVVWEQLIPYFNDGSECIFYVRSPVAIIEGFDDNNLLKTYEYEEGEDYKVISTWSENWEVEEQEALVGVKARSKIFSFSKLIQANEDLMEELYGSHSIVYLTKNRVIVEEYTDHD